MSSLWSDSRSHALRSLPPAVHSLFLGQACGSQPGWGGREGRVHESPGEPRQPPPLSPDSHTPWWGLGEGVFFKISQTVPP